MNLPPQRFGETRDALHRLAAYVISPAREQVTGRIGLRALGGQFGTPPFGDDEVVVAVGGADLVRRDVRGEDRRAITTLAEGAAWLGVEIDPTRADRFDVPPAGDVAAKLAVDERASSWLVDWYDLAADVLEGLRAGFTAAEGATETQLWPEHFDIAMSGGDEQAGQRANFGASPGDAAIAEPYFYVGPWSSDGLGDGFFPNGSFASLRLSEIGDQDARATTLGFLRRGRDVLRNRSPI